MVSMLLKFNRGDIQDDVIFIIYATKGMSYLGCTVWHQNDNPSINDNQFFQSISAYTVCIIHDRQCILKQISYCTHSSQTMKMPKIC